MTFHLAKAKHQSNVEQNNFKKNKKEESQYDENSYESSFIAGNQTSFLFKILFLPNRRKCTEINAFTVWQIYMWLQTIFALSHQQVETKYGKGRCPSLSRII